MKFVFSFLSGAVALLALLSLLRGIELYMADGEFQIVQFGTAIVGVFLAGIWLKRARSM
jgi:hypothetical protein